MLKTKPLYSVILSEAKDLFVSAKNEILRWRSE